MYLQNMLMCRLPGNGMNNSRKIFIQGVLTGILLCFLGAGAYFYGPSMIPQKAPKAELSFDDALTKIKSKNIRNIDIRSESMELTGTDGDIYIVNLDASDATRNEILNIAKDSGTSIKLEPASSGYGWIMLIQFLPIVFLGLAFVATLSLGILAYKALFNKRVDK